MKLSDDQRSQIIDLSVEKAAVLVEQYIEVFGGDNDDRDDVASEAEYVLLTQDKLQEYVTQLEIAKKEGDTKEVKILEGIVDDYENEQQARLDIANIRKDRAEREKLFSWLKKTASEFALLAIKAVVIA